MADSSDNSNDLTSSPDAITTLEEGIQADPLIRLFGDHAKARILMVLVNFKKIPLNPTNIVQKAGLSSRQSWYDYRDELLKSGLVVELDEKAGNSPLYALADPEDDPRTEWLEKIYDWTGTYYRDRSTPDK